MKLILRDRNQNVVDAWKTAFRGIPDVEIDKGDLFDLQGDVVISPSNSFFFFSGGIDAVIEQKLHVQHKLRKFLLVEDFDELLVGESILVPTDNEVYRYVASAPTMRVPMKISGTINVFLAFRAALKEILFQNYFNEEHKLEGSEGAKDIIEPILSILCPGMGTGIGGLDPSIAAFQMVEAYNQIMLGQTRFFDEISAAYRFQISLAKGIIPPTEKTQEDEILAKYLVKTAGELGPTSETKHTTESTTKPTTTESTEHSPNLQSGS